MFFISIAYYNGKFMPIEEVRIPLEERSIYFGDSIYDAAIGSLHGIHLIERHTDRFFESAERVGIRTRLSKKSLCSLLREATVRSGEECAFIYFQLTRTSIARRHSIGDSGSSLLITVTRAALPKPDDTVKLVTYPDKRYGYCNVKTTNLLPAVLASTYADKMGADEAVFIKGDTVTECAHSNVMIVKDGKLITHPKGERILPGITRELLLLGCRKMGIAYEERPFTKEELYDSDEILVTSCSRLVRRAILIDGVKKELITGGIGEKLTNFVYLSFVKCTKL